MEASGEVLWKGGMVFGIKGENRRLLSLVTAVGFGIVLLGQTCSGEVEMSTRRDKTHGLPVIMTVSSLSVRAAIQPAILPSKEEDTRRVPLMEPAVLPEQEKDTWLPVERRRKKGNNNPRDQDQDFRRELKAKCYYSSRDPPLLWDEYKILFCPS